MQSIKPLSDIISAASSPQAAYTALISAQRLQPDAGQAAAVALLDRYFVALQSGKTLRKRRSIAAFFARSKRNAALPDQCGVYLWGDVGRGKSMLMDVFYDTLHSTPKKRVHFHAFMQDVHRRIHHWRQLKPKADLVSRVALEMAQEARLLCLDEMQVHDITDAAILSRLFTLLFQQGVQVVFTSNRPPTDLYKNGIQREQFEPFIALIEQHMNVHHIKSSTDYRLAQLRALRQSYLYPLDEGAAEFLYSSYQTLTQGQPSQPLTLEVQGRRIKIQKTASGVAWLTFAELCERPLGAADYLEIASMFHTLVLQDIPQLTPEKRNEAKRFVTLIDTLYEHRVKLICSAAAPPEFLYSKGDGSFEFERTASRLIEMQSERYLSLGHVRG